jgi:replicative DNA helicase
MLQNKFEHLHTEKAIIASIFKDPDLLINLDNSLSISAFKSPVNRELIKASLELYSSGYTRFTIDMLFNKISVSPVQGLAINELRMYINSLFTADIHTANFKSYLDDLTDVNAKGELIKILQNHVERINKDGEAIPSSVILSDLQNDIFSVEGRFYSRDDEPQDLCLGIKERMLDRVNNSNKYAGIPSGMSLLDEVTLGWLKTKFYFVAARPKTGKSALLSQFSYHAAFFSKLRRVRVLYLDTEIRPSEFECRMVGHIAAVDHRRLMQGDWYHNQKASENIVSSLDFLEKNQGNLYHKYIPGFKTANVVSLIKKYVYNYGVELVVFDYIKEPKDVSDKARWQKIGDLARALKDTAGELDIPVLSALQQNKKGEGMSRTGGEAYGESDDVLKECDAAFMLNWKSSKEIQNETLQAGTHRLQVERARYTQSLYNGINLRFYGYCLRFVTSPIQNLIDASIPQQEEGEETNAILPTATERQVEALAAT